MGIERSICLVPALSFFSHISALCSTLISAQCVLTPVTPFDKALDLQSGVVGHPWEVLLVFLSIVQKQRFGQPREGEWLVPLTHDIRGWQLGTGEETAACITLTLTLISLPGSSLRSALSSSLCGWKKVRLCLSVCEVSQASHSQDEFWCGVKEFSLSAGTSGLSVS